MATFIQALATSFPNARICTIDSMLALAKNVRIDVYDEEQVVETRRRNTKVNVLFGFILITVLLALVLTWSFELVMLAALASVFISACILYRHKSSIPPVSLRSDNYSGISPKTYAEVRRDLDTLCEAVDLDVEIRFYQYHRPDYPPKDAFIAVRGQQGGDVLEAIVWMHPELYKAKPLMLITSTADYQPAVT